jgi:hypothetical protein
VSGPSADQIAKLQELIALQAKIEPFVPVTVNMEFVDSPKSDHVRVERKDGWAWRRWTVFCHEDGNFTVLLNGTLVEVRDFATRGHAERFCRVVEPLFDWSLIRTPEDAQANQAALDAMLWAKRCAYGMAS